MQGVSNKICGKTHPKKIVTSANAERSIIDILQVGQAGIELL